MPNQVGKDKMATIRTICTAVGIISTVLFIPQFQELLIAFAESIKGKSLNHPIWKQKMILFEILFLFVMCYIVLSGKITKNHVIWYVTIAGIFNTIVFLLREYKTGDFSFCDFDGQRKLCAYTLHQINPFKYELAPTSLIDELGSVPSGFGTTPWGLILGNLYYPGFLPQSIGRIYFFILHFSAAILTSCCLFSKTKNMNKHFCFFSTAFPIYTQYLFWALPHANCGGIISCFIILACLYCERQTIAGVLLAFAMVKPQSALLFCLVFLLQKRYKAIAIAAIVDIFAWALASLLTSTNPVHLLTDFLATNTGGSYVYRGLFTFLQDYNLNSSIVMILNMIVGVAFVTIFHLLWKKIPLYDFFYFAPAGIAVHFWCYNWNYDLFTFVIMTSLCIHTALLSKNKWNMLFGFFISVFVCFYFQIDSCLTFFCNLFIKNNAHIFWYGHAVYDVCLIIITICITRFLHTKKLS